MSSVITVSAITFVVMALAILAMAVGVMVSGREIKGSCGGLNDIGGADCACRGQCEGAARGPRG
jgi:hypothetical protein